MKTLTLCRKALLAVILATSTLVARDRPPVAIQTGETPYPVELAFSNITQGSASLVISVNADGTLEDILVAGYTHPAFGRAAEEAARRWKFKPALRDGNPINARSALQIHFSSNGRVLTTLNVGDFLENLLPSGARATYTSLVSELRELDAPVVAHHTLSPRVPVSDDVTTSEQEVLIDFYIDTKGHPRLPLILNRAELSYADAAISALSHWRFDPPTKRGAPTTVRVRQRFVFPADS